MTAALATHRARGWLLAACLAASFALGAAKLFVQRAHPPEWATIEANHFDGFVAIDHFAHRAAWVRDWLGGDPAGLDRLVRSLREELHPTTVSVPLLAGAVAALGWSVPFAYALVVGACFLATLWLCGRIAVALLPAAAEARGVATTARIVLASHCLTGRTVLQLNVDHAVALATALTVLLTIHQVRAPTPWRLLALVVCGWFGVFTKISFLPALALPSLGALVMGKGPGRWRQAAVLALVPVVVAGTAWVFVRALGHTSLTGIDTGELLAASPDPWPSRQFLIEMALLFQCWPLALWRAGRQHGAPRFVAASVLLICAATWWFHFPTIPRLYLGVLALLAAVGAVELRLGRLLPWLAVANLALAAAGLWLG